MLQDSGFGRVFAHAQLTDKIEALSKNVFFVRCGKKNRIVSSKIKYLQCDRGNKVETFSHTDWADYFFDNFKVTKLSVVHGFGVSSEL